MPIQAEESPISKLAKDLAKAAPLAAAGVAVLAGNAQLVRQGKPPRIVLIPTEGPYEAPQGMATQDASVPGAIADVDQEIVAHVWGTSLDEAWELQRRLLQALEEQAAAAGLYWTRGGLVWDSEPDGSKQGQAVNVTFSVRLAVDRVAPSTGQVDAVQYIKV